MENEFSVCQFFEDGSYEYVRQWVDADEAVRAFKHYSTSIAAKLGMTRRVILTDGGDYINAEWQFGKGLTFPPPDPDANAEHIEDERPKTP